MHLRGGSQEGNNPAPSDSSLKKLPCGYGSDIVYKVFSEQLRYYSPEAWYLLRRMKLTTEILEDIMGRLAYAQEYMDKYPSMEIRRRVVVSEWIQQNSELVKSGCRSLPRLVAVWEKSVAGL